MNFSQLLHVQGVKDVRQTETHTVQPLVPKPSAFETDMAIENIKIHKSTGTDQIPAEVIKAGGRTIHCEIRKLINSIWNTEELPTSGLPSPTYKVLSTILVSRLTPYVEEIIRNHQCGF
jgi:hypothetical protein